MKTLLLLFNAKVGRDHIFEPTTGNESFYLNSKVNGVRIINLATSKFCF
jgi:hypothetical protein